MKSPLHFVKINSRLSCQHSCAHRRHSINLLETKMGAFFTIIGIDRVSREDAVSAFRQFESSDGTPVELFACDSGATTVLVGDMLYDSESIVAQLSKILDVPTLLLSYSDDVVWGYQLFRNGEMMDRYSSRPTHWNLHGGVKEDDLAGSASTVAQIWTNVEESQISRYLTNKEVISEQESSEKAYPDDIYNQGDAWQMCDFMKRLGLTYPANEDGELVVNAIASLNVSTEKGRAQKADNDARMAEVLAKFKAMRAAE